MVKVMEAGETSHEITLPAMTPLIGILPKHRAVTTRGYRIRYKSYSAYDVESLPLAFFFCAGKMSVTISDELPDKTWGLEDLSFVEWGYTILSVSMLSKHYFMKVEDSRNKNKFRLPFGGHEVDSNEVSGDEEREAECILVQKKFGYASLSDDESYLSDISVLNRDI